MGMFDEVRVPIEFQTCPHCQQPVDGFQSKDGRRILERIDYHMVDRFYTCCAHCLAWIEYERATGSRAECLHCHGTGYNPDVAKPSDYVLRRDGQ